MPINLQAAEKEKVKQYTDTYKLLNLFGDVFERVRTSYVTKISDKDLIEAAITGMLTSLDPHSSYLAAKDYKNMRVQTRGKFGGLGIEVTMEGGLIKVVSPIDDTPAQRAGIKSGDLITHLNKERVQGLTLSQAVDKMRGKVGEEIELTIIRAGKDPFDVIVKRGIIPIRSVKSRIEATDVGYIRISSFSQPTKKELLKALKKIKKELGKDFIGLVLDLRNNPGGLLDQAIAVSDAFLDKGEIVSTRGRKKETHQRFNARPGDLIDGKPIVVLINGGSASASEIVAGALQDHKRAIIVGTNSFGKGSVQTIIPFRKSNSDKTTTGIRLTTARYYTPSGESIQGKGIKPDIIIKQGVFESKEFDRFSEADLKDSLDNENKKIENIQKEDEKIANERLSKDYQLARAIDLIHGINVYQQTLSEK